MFNDLHKKYCTIKDPFYLPTRQADGGVRACVIGLSLTLSKWHTPSVFLLFLSVSLSIIDSLLAIFCSSFARLFTRFVGLKAPSTSDESAKLVVSKPVSHR